MDFYQMLELASNRLTRAEKKISDYIMENPEVVLYKSITDLAALIGVSDSSIFRFCKTVGYDGYQEFKVSFAKSLSIENNTNDPDLMPEDTQLTGEDSVSTIARKMLQTNINALKQTVDVIDYNHLNEAVKLMFESQSIGFFGVGSSNLTAGEAKRKFSRIRKNLIHTDDLHDQIIEASIMDAGDMAIVFTYSGSTKDTLDIMRILKKRGVRIVLITRYPVSNATALADIVLICGSMAGQFNGDSLSSKITQLFVVDILYGAYYLKDYEAARENKTRSLDAISSRIF